MLCQGSQSCAEEQIISSTTASLEILTHRHMTILDLPIIKQVLFDYHNCFDIKNSAFLLENAKDQEMSRKILLKTPLLNGYAGLLG